MTIRGPSFAHLERLSDANGIFEHAQGMLPRRGGGYCTDDVARALVAVLRESPPRDRRLRRLEAVYFAFLFAAQRADGRFHNRRASSSGQPWLDDVGSDDSNGRALWGLGSAARHASTPHLRRCALSSFERGAGFSSSSPRANATAVLGACEVLAAYPEHRQARALLARAAGRMGAVSAAQDWPWPEPRLAYENARLAEARLAAGAALGDRRLVGEGLQLLEWLVSIETRDGHFSFTCVHGWSIGEPRPAFDQQPIEASAMADACARAFHLTGEDRWSKSCLAAAAWFVGRNDHRVWSLDQETTRPFRCSSRFGFHGIS